MGFRFFRRVKLFPGVSVNFSKSGPSVSVGARGAHVTVGPRGVRQTVGIPGTGLYYTTTSSNRTSSYSPPIVPHSDPPPVPAEDRLDLGFFQKLVTPTEEQDLVAGVKELSVGSEDAALEHLRKAALLPDGALLLGTLAYKRNLFDEAIKSLEFALSSREELGQYFKKYGVTASFTINITDEISAVITPDSHGILLLLVEAYQHSHQIQKAVDALNELYQLNPKDVVVILSRVELLVDEVKIQEAYEQVVKLGEGIENDSEMEAGILYSKAKALRLLGMNQPALDLLTSLLRKTGGRSEKLLKAVRYERAIVYEALGSLSQARTDLETIYAQDTGYADVAVRLGLV